MTSSPCHRRHAQSHCRNVSLSLVARFTTVRSCPSSARSTKVSLPDRHWSILPFHLMLSVSCCHTRRYNHPRYFEPHHFYLLLPFSRSGYGQPLRPRGLNTGKGGKNIAKTPHSPCCHRGVIEGTPLLTMSLSTAEPLPRIRSGHGGCKAAATLAGRRE